MIPRSLVSYRKRTDKLFAKFSTVRDIAKREKTQLAIAEQFEKDALAAQAIAQEIAQDIQSQAHKQITGVVSNSLEAVFEEPYSFDIKFERKRGKTDAILLFRRDDLEVDPLSASGGGVVDVAAFALRLSCLVLSCKPRLDRILILDEPFKFVSQEFRSRVRAMMNGLSDQLGIQFIMVTHIDELETGKILKMKKVKRIDTTKRAEIPRDGRKFKKYKKET